MNKIFKVVWSKTKECYVVVSEVAKNNGGKKKALASVLAGLAMVAATAGTPVQADGNYGGSAVNITPNAYNGSNRTSPNSVVVVTKIIQLVVAVTVILFMVLTMWRIKIHLWLLVTKT